MAGTRHALFDIGNVIVDADQRITYAYLDTLGVPHATEFYRIPEYLQFARGKVSEEAYVGSLRRAIGSPLREEQLRRAHDMHIYQVNEEVMSLLKQVHRKIGNEHLGFLTDTTPWQTRRVEQELITSPSLASYGTVFRSDELGYIKSDDGCFEKVISLLGISAADATLIDDSKPKIMKAASCGLDTILYENPQQLERELMRRDLI